MSGFIQEVFDEGLDGVGAMKARVNLDEEWVCEDFGWEVGGPGRVCRVDSGRYRSF